MAFVRIIFLIIVLSVSFVGGLIARELRDSEVRGLRAEASDIVPEEATKKDLEKSSAGDLEASHTLLFVGDIMLSRGIEYYIQKNGGDYRYPFLLMADELRSADILVGNLENPISIRGKNQGSIYSFEANPKALDGLNFAGFDVLSLANNHMWDYGAEALVDTDAFLDEWGIKGVGAGANYFKANEPEILTIGDPSTGSGQVPIAFFSFTNLYPKSLEATASRPGISQFEPELIKSAVTKAKSSGNMVVVLLHWGEEYETKANDFQQNFAKELVDAGADLIVGTHPHVVQEVEQYKNGWIAYSLGNFIFDQGFSEDTSNGLMLAVKIVNGKIEQVKKTRIEFTKTFQPMVIKIHD